MKELLFLLGGAVAGFALGTHLCKPSESTCQRRVAQGFADKLGPLAFVGDFLGVTSPGVANSFLDLIGK